MILTRDAARLDAAWCSIKFAVGHYGASVVVPGTGYVPNNALTASSPQYLGTFYETHPLYRAGLDQVDHMIPCYSFPGSNSVRVGQAIVDDLSRVVQGQATPDTAVHDAAAEVQKLLPRR